MSIAKINRLIAKEGIRAQLVRGQRYCYFIGPDVERAPVTSVMVASVEQLTPEQWLNELRHILTTVPTV